MEMADYDAACRRCDYRRHNCGVYGILPSQESAEGFQQVRGFRIEAWIPQLTPFLPNRVARLLDRLVAYTIRKLIPCLLSHDFYDLLL